MRMMENGAGAEAGGRGGGQEEEKERGWKRGNQEEDPSKPTSLENSRFKIPKLEPVSFSSWNKFQKKVW